MRPGKQLRPPWQKVTSKSLTCLQLDSLRSAAKFPLDWRPTVCFSAYFVYGPNLYRNDRSTKALSVCWVGLLTWYNDHCQAKKTILLQNFQSDTGILRNP